LDLTRKTTGTKALILVFTALVGLTVGLLIGKLEYFSGKSPNIRGKIISIDNSDSYRGLNIKTEAGQELANSSNIDVNLSLDKNVKIKKVKFEIEYWESNDLSSKKYTKAREISSFPIEFTQKIKNLESDSTFKYRVIIDGGYANKEKEFKTKFVIKGLGVTLLNNVLQDKGNSIRPRFCITYNNEKGLDVSKFKIRYYYTIDSDGEENFWCDYAGLNTNYNYFTIESSVKSQFVKMDKPTSLADHYLEISFAPGLEKMDKEAKLDVYCRFSKKDWADYDQTNDYSFSASGTYISWEKITVYYNDELVYGKEPK